MPLIILEGADGTGKTTAMRSLVSHYGYVEIMARESTLNQTAEEMCHKLSYAMTRALRGEFVVIDRCWISEAIYSRYVRGTESRIHPFQARMLERLALSAGVKLVVCDPGETAARSAFMSRDEYIKNVNQWGNVYTAYQQIEMYTSIPVERYNYLTDGGISAVDFSSEKNWDPSSNFYGGRDIDDIYGNVCAGTLIVVNDRYPGVTVPCINWNFDSVSARITRNFAKAGLDEFDLAWINIGSAENLQHSINDMSPVKIVCIGDITADELYKKTQFRPDAILPVPATYEGDYSKILHGVLR